MNPAGRTIENRLRHLEKHLQQENPVLLSTVQSFRRLDRVAYRIGLLDRDESYAAQIPWWPLISILGTFSSGKSTFINHYLQLKLQRTGNQAVDDKFTVICYGRDEAAHTLPGVALDSDPRFPFYQISNDIEQVAAGEGQRIDAYLQLKTCPSDTLRGKIIIDSPGFDADAQRTSTLRITDHIVDLSDLVLVFFDARHPEPGAMQDTLRHLVSDTIRRPDSGKFLYILNQIDTTAREDNPEEVVAAWQRALGEKGLTAGRFYSIYNPDAAVPIEDPNLRRRFEGKRDADLQDIHERMYQVEVERAYRIVATLDKTARDIEERAIPLLQKYLGRWKKWVLWGDGVVFGTLFAALLGLSIKAGYWQGLRFSPPWLKSLLDNPPMAYLSVGLLLLALIALHYLVRTLTSRRLSRQIRKEANRLEVKGNLTQAFLKSTRAWRSIFTLSPAGWGRGARRRLHQIQQESDGYVQELNDKFTDPSGEQRPETSAPPATESEPAATPSAPTEGA